MHSAASLSLYLTFCTVIEHPAALVPHEDLRHTGEWLTFCCYSCYHARQLQMSVRVRAACPRRRALSRWRQRGPSDVAPLLSAACPGFINGVLAMHNHLRAAHK